MKNLFILTFFSVFMANMNAQPLRFEWAKSAGNVGYAQAGTCIATDLSGNVYTAGTFEGTVDFDPGLSVFNLTSQGWDEHDIFVQKLDKNGNFAWAISIGASYREYVSAIDVDDSGNVVLTGNLFGGADFDPGPAVYEVKAPGMLGAFVAKYSPAGSLIWAKGIHGRMFASAGGTALTIDANMNIILAGTFKDTVDFDPDSISNYNLGSVGLSDVFVLKLDPAGHFIWSKSFGGSADEFVKSMALDNNGNICMTGGFAGMTDFDPHPINTSYLQSDGDFDIFVSKLDATGTFKWAKKMGGLKEEYGNGIGVDAKGNVYTAGLFKGMADFNPDPIKKHELPAPNNVNQIFLSKLDSSGQFMWAKSMGGTEWDEAFSLEVDPAGNTYACGAFQGTADFDPDSSSKFELTVSSGPNNSDLFVSKFDSEGDFIWAIGLGGTLYTYATDIVRGPDRKLHLTGTCRGKMDFDPDTSTYYLSSTNENVFTLQCSEIQKCNIDNSFTVTNNTLTANASNASYQWLNCGTNQAIPGATSRSFQPLSSGQYAVAITKDSCVDTSACKMVKICNIDTSVTRTDSILTAKIDNANYQWIDCSTGNSISGAIGKIFQPLKNGRYAVIIIKDSCQDTSTCIDMHVVGMSLIQTMQVEVKPNPVNDILNIQLSNQIDFVAIRLFDLYGTMVYSNNITENDNTNIDMSSLESGVYYLSLNTKTFKILKL